MLDFPFLIICLFVAIFFVQTLRRYQLNWLWFAVAIWLVLGFFSASILPRILGITHSFNLYLVHFYVFCGSVFFFMNSANKLPERAATWQATRAGSYLTLLATSGLAMNLAFFILLSMVYWQYPQGFSAILLARLLNLYALDPVFWYATQFLLMAIFALHRKMVGDSCDVFSLKQIQIGLLLCLLWQFVYLVGWQSFVRLFYFLWINLLG